MREYKEYTVAHTQCHSLSANVIIKVTHSERERELLATTAKCHMGCSLSRSNITRPAADTSRITFSKIAAIRWKL